jgi:hypothetical protein
MENYEPGMSFGEDTAEIYDDEPRGDEEAAVSLLEQLAGGGPVLELAIGTGRIALPLAARGIRVVGIDISPAMVAKLREKPGGDQISVTMGDFAGVPVSGECRLIYVVYNTFNNLLTKRTKCDASRTSRPTSPTTARSSWRPECRTSSTACAAISTWMRKPSASMRCGSTSVDTTRRGSGTTRPMCA